MKYVILVILLIFCLTSHALQCLFDAHQSIELEQLQDLNITLFFNTIKELPSKNFDNTHLCRINFYIHFSPVPFVIVRLTNDFLHNNLNDSEVEIHTYIGSVEKNNTEVFHDIEYACSSDECDREFLNKFEKTIEWFFDARYTNLTDKISKITVGNQETHNEKIECFDDEKMNYEDCSSGRCFALVDQVDVEKYQLRQACVNEFLSRHTEIFSYLRFDFNLTYWYINFSFYCIYNQCNNQTIAIDAYKTFYDEYNVNQIIKKFGLEINENSTIKQRESPSTTRPSNMVDHIQSSNAMVYLNLIIFLFYLFL